MVQPGFSSCCAHLCYSLPVMTHATGGQQWQTVTDTMLLKQTESGAPFWNLLFLQSHRKWYARKTPPPVSALSFSPDFGTFSKIFLHSATGVLPPTTIKPHLSNVEGEDWWYSAWLLFFFYYCQKIPWNDWKQQHPCSNVRSNHLNPLLKSLIVVHKQFKICIWVRNTGAANKQQSEVESSPHEINCSLQLQWLWQHIFLQTLFLTKTGLVRMCRGHTLVYYRYEISPVFSFNTGHTLPEQNSPLSQAE